MQGDFAKALLDPSAPVPTGIVGPGGTPSAKRFGVYRNNVTVSLIEAMEQAYPTVQMLVGNEYFAAMAKIFVRQFPPETPMMFQYGEQFPVFLDGFAPLAHLPYLPDIARLERARRQSYHAADATGYGAERLGQIAPEALPTCRLTLHPAMRVIASDHPIFSIWRFNNLSQEPITATQEDVLITRPNLDVLMQVIPGGAAVFLKSLGAGDALGMASELALTAHPEFDLAGNLGELLEAGVIIDATV